jgi:hypothetical protein
MKPEAAIVIEPAPEATIESPTAEGMSERRASK